ncbi:cystathionine beta-synthase-like [Belonocnema kinseyi]|uniref:cystathionine beta-synthase-like n=1 Tax=Belonocnema kinseyi TaxID=2817044 RepID=UPI00143DB1CA|nr:cystathionine beta-synthase-like [Belonocnema kinseyi]
MEGLKPNRPTRCTWKANSAEMPHPKRNIQMDQNKILPNILEAIGQTPMVRLNKIPKLHGVKCELLVKCEFMNPGGSLKDRIAYRMIEEAEEKGLLKPGATIIEPTSGNTGIGLALAAAVKGYKCIIFMTERMSIEKQCLIQALGSEVVRIPNTALWDGPDGIFSASQKLREKIPNSVILDQFTNCANALAPYEQTAKEIWEQTEGKIDYFVAGSGTGGTLTGIGRRLRELSPNTKIIAVDPEGSIVAEPPELNETTVTRWQMEGIGYVFTPTSLDKNVINKWIKSNDCDSFRTARNLIQDEGLLVGGSSGAVVSAALKLAKDLPADKRVVILLPDGIRNYMTKFVSDYWMEMNGFLSPPEPIESNEWWWNLPVSSILIKYPTTLSKKSTCKEAMHMLKEKHFRQLPITNVKDEVVGMVTLNEILSDLISGKLQTSDCVEKIMKEEFRKIDLRTPLGLISRILEKENYAVVLDEEKENRFVGILTQIDLIDFIDNSKSTFIIS